jgi:hypothetical protein
LAAPDPQLIVSRALSLVGPLSAVEIDSSIAVGLAPGTAMTIHVARVEIFGDTTKTGTVEICVEPWLSTMSIHKEIGEAISTEKIRPGRSPTPRFAVVDAGRDCRILKANPSRSRQFWTQKAKRAPNHRQQEDSDQHAGRNSITQSRHPRGFPRRQI